MNRVHVFITGDVIGVGFRAWILRQAQDFQLTGWVKNVFEPIKGVEAVFEGKKENVEKMIELCKKGPEVSWVENVEVTSEQSTGSFDGFTIR